MVRLGPHLLSFMSRTCFTGGAWMISTHVDDIGWFGKPKRCHPFEASSSSSSTNLANLVGRTRQDIRGPVIGAALSQCCGFRTAWAQKVELVYVESTKHLLCGLSRAYTKLRVQAAGFCPYRFLRRASGSFPRCDAIFPCVSTSFNTTGNSIILDRDTDLTI